MSLILPPNPDIELIKSELQSNYKKKFQNTLVENLNSLGDDDNGEILTKDLLDDLNVYEMFLFEYIAQQQQGYFIEMEASVHDDILVNSHLFKFLARLINTNLIAKFNAIKNSYTQTETDDYSAAKQSILNDCIDLYTNSIKRFNFESVASSFARDITNWLKWCKYSNLKGQNNDCLPPVDDSIFVVFLIFNRILRLLKLVQFLARKSCNIVFKIKFSFSIFYFFRRSLNLHNERSSIKLNTLFTVFQNGCSSFGIFRFDSRCCKKHFSF